METKKVTGKNQSTNLNTIEIKRGQCKMNRSARCEHKNKQERGLTDLN